MFNYFRKYICVHASSINLMKKRTRQQQFPIFFTSSLFISVTKKFSFNIRKTISLKIEKKTSIEAQSEGHALVDKTSEFTNSSEATKPIDENESEARDFDDSNPVALDRSLSCRLSTQFGSQSRKVTLVKLSKDVQ